MFVFHYTAIDAAGRRREGKESAQNESEARRKLKSGGLFVTQLEKISENAQPVQKPKPLTVFGGSVNNKTLTRLTHQLAALLAAGIPLVRGLKILHQQEQNRQLRDVVASLARSIEEGCTFSESLAQHPRIFDRFYINMARAGETSGSLEVVLERLAAFMEKIDRAKSKVFISLVYPTVILLLSIAILILLTTFIVPRFKAIFADMLGDRPLPGLTQAVIAFTDGVQEHAMLIGVGIVVLLIAYRIILRIPTGIFFVDSLKLKIPFLGDLFKKVSIAHFTRTLGTLLTNGVSILPSLDMARNTVNNEVFSKAIFRIHERVKEGESLAASLQSDPHFPPLAASMVQVGEETGRLPEMLEKIADIYEGETQNAFTAFTSLLEPMMIILLALIVGTIVVALFMPLISIITNLSSGV